LPVAAPTDISKRKADHLVLAGSGAAAFRDKDSLLADVHLVHQSLPECAVEEIDLTTTLFGQTLKAPLVITGMTGGTEVAAAINRDLARAAQAFGLAFGVGSQRAMAEHPELTSTYMVRDVAPDIVLLGNLGAVQAKTLGPEKVQALCEQIGATALAIHLNPAQELMQAEGDRDFRGLLRTVFDLKRALTIPLLVKETGCGLSPETAAALRAAGIETVDVSGAGGTSWVAVEAKRAESGSVTQNLGEELWDWGLPTAVSIVACRQHNLNVIASGGVRSGYDVARALALGACAGGFAQPVLRAHQLGGYLAVVELIEQVIRSIATVTLLSGKTRALDLDTAPRHIGRRLSSYLHDLGLR
jgi:isopentenyl-diphosphate delta-isomerase